MNRPSIKSPCVADRYAMTGERIAEFRIGKVGGLISLRETLIGGARLEVYRVDGGPLEVVAPADPLRDAAPAMRDALALALPWIERTGIADEDPAEYLALVAALALAGGDTVATPAAPDYAAILKDLAGQMTVEAVLRIIGGPDWRAIAASLLPYAESRAEDMDENACETADQGLDSAPYDRELADEAVAAVDAAKAALAGDTMAAMSAPQDGGEVAVDIAGALQIVIDLARGNLADERDMPEEYARQIDAINQVEDMAVNQFGDA